ncbi:MAG: tryptophan 7-halogenase [Ginsengibacter sp.]
MEARAKYDVLIAGGGLAGLTLALQLVQNKPGISILILEKRTAKAAACTHKVGESLSELGSSYFREILNLKEYLIQHQLPKFGFRFFFSPEHSDDITRRVEVGSKIFNPYPSHQVDRGLLENDLICMLEDCNVDIMLGAKVMDVELSESGHKLRFETVKRQHNTRGRWIVDATGRNSFLKKKLKLQKEIDHDINAVWFRLNAVIDIDEWSSNLKWRNFVDPGRRRLATSHLMGEGYWIWIIPLISGKTSIGIVADPKYHPFNGYNTFEKAMKWLGKHEPHAARVLDEHRELLMDFKVMKDFAYDTKQFYSADRWALTGEAGAFMDPFYSPGIDFIALGNSWITDLIIRDVGGENTTLRTMVYDMAHKELLHGWISLYRNMYGIFGKTQVMLMKIVWDWATYWAILNVLFINNGYTDIDVLKQYSSINAGIGRRFSKLNEQMQELFRAWAQYDIEPCADHQLNIFDLECLHKLHTELGVCCKPGELIGKVASNLKILEQISAEIFRLVSARIHGTPADMKVDPYEMKIDDGKDELLKKSINPNALSVVDPIRIDIARMWLQNIKTPENEFA